MEPSEQDGLSGLTRCVKGERRTMHGLLCSRLWIRDSRTSNSDNVRQYGGYAPVSDVGYCATSIVFVFLGLKDT